MWSMWFVFIVWLQRRSKQWDESSNIIKFGRYIFIRASQTAWDLYINFVLNIVANFARSVSVCYLFIGPLWFSLSRFKCHKASVSIMSRSKMIISLENIWPMCNTKINTLRRKCDGIKFKRAKKHLSAVIVLYPKRIKLHSKYMYKILREHWHRNERSDENQSENNGNEPLTYQPKTLVGQCWIFVLWISLCLCRYMGVCVWWNACSKAII